MPPIDTSALAAIFAWVWGQYGKTITDKTLKAAWERLRWEDRALAYGQKMQRLYGTIQILGQPKPVSLEGIYTAVSLLDRPTALSRYTVAEMQAEFTERDSRYFHAGDENKRRDGLEMVKEGQNLFVLGKPGAGKTTFLKHVALRGVGGELGRVPIFVGLKQLSDSGLSVFDFVVNEFDVCDFPDAADYLGRLLKAGKAILLFDGLDEVNVADEERARLIMDVEKFTRKYDRCQRLITCRLASNDYSFQNYTYVEMADFNEGQIREFVVKWFSGDDKQRERRDLFLSELDKAESEGLRELARVPLLLALLCLGFEETLKLSSRRAELYQEALDALLRKWDAGRNIQRDEIYRGLSPKRKEQMLAQVAAETFDRAEYFIPKKVLARSFETFLARVPNVPAEADGEVVLRAIIEHHGLFLERARGIYSFAHLTFQEYFTARYVVDYQKDGTLPRLVEHYADPRYREVFLMTAAQLPDGMEFFDQFLKRLADDARRYPAVVGLLRQGAHKAATAVGADVSAATVRSIYLFLALALTHSRDLARDLALVRTRARTITRSRALARARDLARALTLDRTIALERDRPRAPDYDSALARALARAFARPRGRDLVLDSAYARDLALDRSLNRARGLGHADSLNLARDLDLDLNLARALALTFSPYRPLARDIGLLNARLILEITLAWPNVKGETQTLFGLAGEFLANPQVHLLGDSSSGKGLVDLDGHIKRAAIGLAQGDDAIIVAREAASELDAFLEEAYLVFPALDGEELDFIVGYLGGNLLLLECLSQAIVANRTAIKESLLL